MYALFHLQVKVKRCYIPLSAVADVTVMCNFEHNVVTECILYYI